MLTIVTGPPCSGKSTYIRQRAQPGHIIIDMDRIALALTTEDTNHHAYPEHIKQLAQLTRRTAITNAIALHHQGHTTWIIDTRPGQKRRQEYHRNGAQFVHLDPGIETCLARAAGGERPADIIRFIHRYYHEQTEPTSHTVTTSRKW
jgi:predicted kinase